MNRFRLLLRQIMWEQKMFWRNPAAAVFTFVFPIIFLVIFSAINSDDLVGPDATRVEFTQYYVPAIVVFGIISACYTSVAFTLSIRRTQGILKRKRGTPLTASTYLGGIVGSALVVAILLSVVTFVIGAAAYDFTFPEVGSRVPALALLVVVMAFCFTALGALVSTFVPNEDAAPAMINVVLFPLVFISGTFGPLQDDSTLTKIAQFFPVWHSIQATTNLLNPLKSGALDWGYVLVLVSWGLGGALLTWKRFRWDPDPALSAPRSGRGRRSRTRRSETAAVS
jgi:ABC-2 type transport system permease protein